MNIMEIIQKIQLKAYQDGIIYHARKNPIPNTVQTRIKLPICNVHDINPLTQFCKKCGISMEELYENSMSNL